MGGRRGAIIGATVNSIIISFLPLYVLPVLGDLKMAASTFADTDYLIPGILLGKLGETGAIALTTGIIAFTVIVILVSMFMKSPKAADDNNK